MKELERGCIRKKIIEFLSDGNENYFFEKTIRRAIGRDKNLKSILFSLIKDGYLTKIVLPSGKIKYGLKENIKNELRNKISCLDFLFPLE